MCNQPDGPPSLADLKHQDKQDGDQKSDQPRQSPLHGSGKLFSALTVFRISLLRGQFIVSKLLSLASLQVRAYDEKPRVPPITFSGDYSMVERRWRNRLKKADGPDWALHPIPIVPFPNRHNFPPGIPHSYSILWSDNSGEHDSPGSYKTHPHPVRDSHHRKCARASPSARRFYATPRPCAAGVQSLLLLLDKPGILNKALHMRTSY